MEKFPGLAKVWFLKTESTSQGTLGESHFNSQFEGQRQGPGVQHRDRVISCSCVLPANVLMSTIRKMSFAQMTFRKRLDEATEQQENPAVFKLQR